MLSLEKGVAEVGKLDSRASRYRMVCRSRLVWRLSVKNAKKLMFAALAALMIAGSLSAVSGATSMSSFGPVAVVGEGPSPLPVVLSAVPDNDTSSFGKHF